MRFIVGEPLEQFVSRAMIRILHVYREKGMDVWRTELEARAIGASKLEPSTPCNGDDATCTWHGDHTALNLHLESLA